MTAVLPASELPAVLAKQMSEGDLAARVHELFDLYGWRWVHFRPARTEKGWRTAIEGMPGFFDEVAVRGHRLLFIELKSQKGRLGPGQQEWYDAIRHLQISGTFFAGELRGVHIHLPELYCWYPDQWISGEIAGILGPEAK